MRSRGVRRDRGGACRWRGLKGREPGSKRFRPRDGAYALGLEPPKAGLFLRKGGLDAGSCRGRSPAHAPASDVSSGE